MSEPTEPRPARRLPIGRILVAIAVTVLCVVLARKLDLDRLGAALRSADWRLVAAAGLIHVTVNTAARVGRWKSLLAPLPREGAGARFGELTVLYFASQAASNLLPARAGEALRVVQLRRRHNYLVSDLVTAQIVETLVGAVTLGLFTLPMVPLGEAPASLSVPITLFALAGPVGLGALVLVSRFAPVRASEEESAASAPSGFGPARVLYHARNLVRRLLQAVQQIHAPRVWMNAMSWSVLSDITDVSMIGLVLTAVGIHLAPTSWVVIYAAVNLVLIAPTTPAQIGVLEVGAVAALRTFGVDEHPALAFALLYHAAHVVPPTLVGAALLVGLDARRASDAPRV